MSWDLGWVQGSPYLYSSAFWVDRGGCGKKDGRLEEASVTHHPIQPRTHPAAPTPKGRMPNRGGIQPQCSPGTTSLRQDGDDGDVTVPSVSGQMGQHSPKGISALGQSEVSSQITSSQRMLPLSQTQIWQGSGFHTSLSLYVSPSCMQLPV